MWLQVKSSEQTLFVANVYRPPRPSDDKIFDALAHDVEHFQAGSTKTRVLLFGDFNCHHSTWLGSMDMHGKPKTNSAGVACYSLCQTSGLVNVITGNTFLRNKGNAESTLDLILTDNPAW